MSGVTFNYNTSTEYYYLIVGISYIIIRVPLIGGASRPPTPIGHFPDGHKDLLLLLLFSTSLLLHLLISLSLSSSSFSLS